MTLPRTLRTSAAAMAVAAAFGTVAPAYALNMDDPAALNRYAPALSEAVAKAAADDMAHLRVGGFVVEFEKKLRAPMDRPQFVGYPNPAANGQLVLSAVIPPRSKFASANIPVCVEMGDRILGTYSITPDGRVLTDTWAGMAQPTASATGFAFLCKDHITARGRAMMPGPAQPPPVKAENPPAPRTEAPKPGPVSLSTYR